MSLSNKLITVFGATGTQGGSVIRSLLKHSASQKFNVRGITRDVSKPAAKALVQQGVEMRSADMASRESVFEALSGSHAVFLVTTPNFMNPEADDEYQHGKNVADAAKDAGVEHLVFSSLVDVTKISGGRLKHVLHFDRKAHVEDYIRSIGLPSTFVLAGYFMSNYTALGMIRKGEDGIYTLAYPVSENAQVPLVDAASDIGKFVAASILAYPASLGKQILAASDYYTPGRIVSEFTEVTGQKARFVSIDAATYKSFLPPQMAEEMLENHLLLDEPGYYNGQPLEESKKILQEIGEHVVTWKEFLAANKSSFA